MSLEKEIEMSPNMDSGYIGVRFILEHGSFFQAIVQKNEARKLIQDFITGKLTTETIGGLDTNSPMGAGSWGVKVKSVIGIHTFDLQAVQQAGPQQPMPPQGFPQQRPLMGGHQQQYRSGG